MDVEGVEGEGECVLESILVDATMHRGCDVDNGLLNGLATAAMALDLGIMVLNVVNEPVEDGSGEHDRIGAR